MSALCQEVTSVSYSQLRNPYKILGQLPARDADVLRVKGSDVSGGQASEITLILVHSSEFKLGVQRARGGMP
jgi:hypothetical protein